MTQAPLEPTDADRDRAGLCATCVHAEVIRTDRGSTFFRCRLSVTRPEFPRYPRLPVIACGGWSARTSSL